MMQLTSRTAINRAIVVPTAARRVRARAQPVRPPFDGPEEGKSIIDQGKPPSQSENPDKVASVGSVVNRWTDEKQAAHPPPLEEVMAWNGTAPEIINGRLAMLGFVTAVAAELNTGASVLNQVQINPFGIASVFLIIIVASFFPFSVNKKVSKVEAGPFTNFFNPTAEIINGRSAMIGFAALLATEYFKGGALF